MNYSDEILNSWQANAENWIAAIDGNEIESRVLVTNDAIFNIIVKYSPANILDVGCGEGWLLRKLLAHGINGHGIDAIDSLIKNAIKKGGNNYTVCNYEDFMNTKLELLKEMDAAVINFALLDKENSEKLLKYLSGSLNRDGLIFLQTLHPINIALNDDYETGWKSGSWTGLNKDFKLPYKWYFRTIEDWLNTFCDAGLTLTELKETIHPKTKKPFSMIFVLRV